MGVNRPAIEQFSHKLMAAGSALQSGLERGIFDASMTVKRHVEARVEMKLGPARRMSHNKSLKTGMARSNNVTFKMSSGEASGFNTRYHVTSGATLTDSGKVKGVPIKSTVRAGGAEFSWMEFGTHRHIVTGRRGAKSRKRRLQIVGQRLDARAGVTTELPRYHGETHGGALAGTSPIKIGGNVRAYAYHPGVRDSAFGKPWQTGIRTALPQMRRDLQQGPIGNLKELFK